LRQSLTQAPLERGGWVRVTQTIPLASAALWFPTNRPDGLKAPMYTLVSNLTVDGVAVDVVRTPFGVREVDFDAQNGLFINGFPLRIRGLSMHTDFAGVGVALPPELEAYRMQRLLDMGANGWRTAHCPVNPGILDLADKRGVLVWLENRFLRAFGPSVQEAVDMVRQNRNHPSVFLYSLCNENGCLEGEGYEFAPPGAIAGAAVAQMYKDAMYELDGTRPITANTHALADQPGTILDALNVLGVTYDYNAYDALHERYPFKTLMGGESASCVSDRAFREADNDTAGWVSSYDPLGCTGPAWSPAVTARPFVAGNFVWAGQDYAGESEWPAVSSHYGVLDLQGMAKPSYFWYRAWWGLEAGHPGAGSRVFAFPAWSFAPGTMEGQTVQVVAYAAAAAVQLYLNGVAVGGVQAMPQYGYVSWPAVPFTPGNMTVVSLTADGSVAGISRPSRVARPPP
jgi:beta-galactosidase